MNTNDQYNAILHELGERANKHPSRLYEIFKHEPPRVRAHSKKHMSFFSLSYGVIQTDLMHADKLKDRRFKYLIIFVEMASKKVHIFPSSSKSSDAWYKAVMSALQFFGSKCKSCATQVHDSVMFGLFTAISMLASDQEPSLMSRAFRHRLKTAGGLKRFHAFTTRLHKLSITVVKCGRWPP